jgi:phosphinothricin acetyltransferase
MPGIRYVTTEDAARLAAIYNPLVRETAVSFELEPVSPAEMARRVESVARTHPWIVIEEEIDGPILGYAYAAPHRDRPAYRWSVETTVYVDAGHRGQGLGKTLYTALLDLATSWGYATALAGIALPNPASVALHASVGFTQVGVFPRAGFKFDEWHDVGWWYRPLSNLSPPRTTASPG